MGNQISKKELLDIITNVDAEKDVKNRFKEFIKDEDIFRENNPFNHLVVFFFPFIKETSEVLLVLHKGTGLWLSPGAHVESERSLQGNIIKEVKVELGWDLKEEEIDPPLTITITKATAKNKPCKLHYDIWYPIPIQTKDKEIILEKKELGGYKWLNVKKALEVVKDNVTLVAIKSLIKKYKLG